MSKEQSWYVYGELAARDSIIAQLETEYWVLSDGTPDWEDPRNIHLRDVIARVKSSHGKGVK
jgi:hypothetical protein